MNRIRSRPTAIVLGCVVATAGACHEPEPPAWRPPPLVLPQIKGVRLIADGNVEVATFTDDAEMAALVKEALEGAAYVPNPARYVGVGALILTYADGSEEWFGLFLPMGNFERKRNYFEADFTRFWRVVCERNDGKGRWLFE